MDRQNNSSLNKSHEFSTYVDGFSEYLQLRLNHAKLLESKIEDQRVRKPFILDALKAGLFVGGTAATIASAGAVAPIVGGISLALAAADYGVSALYELNAQEQNRLEVKVITRLLEDNGNGLSVLQSIMLSRYSENIIVVYDRLDIALFARSPIIYRLRSSCLLSNSP